MKSFEQFLLESSGHEAAFLGAILKNHCDQATTMAFIDWLQDNEDPAGEILLDRLNNKKEFTETDIMHSIEYQLESVYGKNNYLVIKTPETIAISEKQKTKNYKLSSQSVWLDDKKIQAEEVPAVIAKNLTVLRIINISGNYEYDSWRNRLMDYLYYRTDTLLEWIRAEIRTYQFETDSLMSLTRSFNHLEDIPIDLFANPDHVANLLKIYNTSLGHIIEQQIEGQQEETAALQELATRFRTFIQRLRSRGL